MTQPTISTPSTGVLQSTRIPVLLPEAPVAMAPPEAAPSDLAALPPLWHRLQFNMQFQVQSNWCWSATTASVNRYYNPYSTWTQCSLANAHLGQTTCCANGSSPQCNVPSVLSDVLTLAGNLRSFEGQSAALSKLQPEIDAGRPVAARIGWSGGGGHFVVLEGYRAGITSMVAVEDPIFGSSDITYDTFRTNYQGSGSWTHTYYTKSAPIRILGATTGGKRAVSAVSRDPNKLDVFAVDAGGTIITSAWDQNVANDQWRGWWPIVGGRAAPGAPVTAVARDPNKLDVFVVGLDGGVWTAAWDQNVAHGQWRGWWRIGNVQAAQGSPIAVVARDPNKLDVFVIGADGGIYTAAWDQHAANAQWRGWWRITSGQVPLTSSVAAVARDPNKLDVFTIGADGGIYTAAWDQFVSNAEWRGWWRITNGLVASNAPVTAVARDPNKLDVFTIGLDGGLWTAAWDQFAANARWRGWWRIGEGQGNQGAPLAAVARGPSKLDVFMAGSNGGIYTAAWAQEVASATWLG
jgi:hypothetical protein